jgi:hypothetical protein
MRIAAEAIAISIALREGRRQKGGVGVRGQPQLLSWAHIVINFFEHRGRHLVDLKAGKQKKEG